MNIAKISGLEILDSRGNPTVEAYVELENGMVGHGSTPSGASTGTYEATELRDKDTEYDGKGVDKAVNNIDTIIGPALVGMPIDSLKKLDTVILMLDDTPQKKNLGANAVLAVSMALARALALFKGEPLWKTLHEQYFSSYEVSFPRLMINVINGGAHAGWNVDFQEYMLVPREKKPTESVRQGSEIFHALKKILDEKDEITSVGDEGGFAPQLDTNSEGFALVQSAIEKAGYTREQIDLATDAAASEFYKDGSYRLSKENKTLSAEELANYYQDVIRDYDLLSFEDPFSESDWGGFASFTEKNKENRLIVGDDLFVTNIERIKKGIDEKAANAVLIKLNQIGSVYETVQAIKMTREAGWKVIISHRSGETEDSFIADLAVACGADFLKAGSMSRSERLTKYNRLIEIEAREM